MHAINAITVMPYLPKVLILVQYAVVTNADVAELVYAYA